MRDRASLPQPGDVVAGKYLIERMIGSAGQSIVFGARHAMTGKRLAIKWLALDGSDDDEDGDEARPAADEDDDLSAHAQVIGHFRHPNMLDIHDIGHVNGATYIVMDWLEGESLAHRLRRVRSLPLAEVYRVLAPCMRGMHEAHLAGIVHGELKPANIFICSATKYAAETVKVLDFGVSKLSTADADLSTALARSDGSATEHLHYLSPEQLRGMPIDLRSDVYAFGVMVYRALAGRTPYFADSAGELIWQTASGAEPSLRGVPGVPPEIDAMVARAMSRDPDGRFSSLLELAEAFEQCLRSPHLEAITRALAASNPRATPPPLRKRRVSPALSPSLEADHSADIEEAETGPVMLPNLPPLEPGPDRRPLYGAAAAALVVFAAMSLIGHYATLAREKPAASAEGQTKRSVAPPEPAPTKPVDEAAASVVDAAAASIAKSTELARLVNEASGAQTTTATSVAAATSAPPPSAAGTAPAPAKPAAAKAFGVARVGGAAAPPHPPQPTPVARTTRPAPPPRVAPAPAARVTATSITAAPAPKKIDAAPAPKHRDVLDMQLQ